MRRLRWLIPSLVAAGFTAQDAAASPQDPQDDPSAGDGDRPTLFELFRQGHAVTLAQHRSHRSHSSHSSHRSGSGGHYSHTSHRSSTGGYGAPVYTPPPAYTPPAVYVPPPIPATPRRRAPSSVSPTPSLPSRGLLDAPSVSSRASEPGLPALSGRTKRFEQIVKQVQIALLARGLYEGPVDGIVGPALRAALRAHQAANGLPVTGTITPAVLDSLRISSS